MADEILMLNDHCFLEVFKHLSVHDLANFAEAYGSVATVVGMEFNRKTGGSLLFDSEVKIDDVLQIIKQFGPSVQSLRIICDRLMDRTKWNEIFSIINEHCNDKLKLLDISGKATRFITIDDSLLIVDLGKKIETLNIGNHISILESIEILSRCITATSMTTFTPIHIDQHDSILQIKGKQLRLQLCERMDERDLKKIGNDLVHTRLKALCLNLSMTTSSIVLPLFLQNVVAFNSLISLIIVMAPLDEASVAALGRLKQLKALKLTFCRWTTYSSIESLIVLCGNQNLENLTIVCASLDFTIDVPLFQRMIETRKASSARCLNLILSYRIYTASIKAIPPNVLKWNKATIILILMDPCKEVASKLQYLI